MLLQCLMRLRMQSMVIRGKVWILCLMLLHCLMRVSMLLCTLTYASVQVCLVAHVIDPNHPFKRIIKWLLFPTHMIEERVTNGNSSLIVLLCLHGVCLMHALCVCCHVLMVCFCGWCSLLAPHVPHQGYLVFHLLGQNLIFEPDACVDTGGIRHEHRLSHGFFIIILIFIIMLILMTLLICDAHLVILLMFMLELGQLKPCHKSLQLINY